MAELAELTQTHLIERHSAIPRLHDPENYITGTEILLVKFQILGIAG
jgi:hypothetical protein